MGSKERREREKEHLKQEILDAARELFLKEGYEKVTMRRIAQRIEYSPTTIYLYFNDKSDIFLALCDEVFLRLARELDKISKSTPDPMENLRRGMKAYIKFGLRYPGHYRLVLMSPDIFKESDFRFQFEGSAGEKAFRFLMEAIQRAMDQGILRKGDLMLASQTAWTSIHGVTSLLITKGKFPWVKQETLIDSVVETVIRGLRE